MTENTTDTHPGAPVPPVNFELTSLWEEGPPQEVPLFAAPVPTGIVFQTNSSFWSRLWYLISNPLRYLFNGEVKL